ncbi:hypothetical protein GGI12_001999 [Dipsacomyces acuminosporus]|nr:hypothetical protein GGI12_001999 [Dipsacomyces acuminosporus]
MHINDLGLCILGRVFTILSHCYDKHHLVRDPMLLVPIASVCRTWRTCVSPSIHNKVIVKNKGHKDSTTSNIQDILARNCLEHIHVLRIDIARQIVETVDLVKILEEAGAGQIVWQKITKIEIRSGCRWVYEKTKGMLKAHEPRTKLAVDFLEKHFPHLREIIYMHKNYNSSMHNMKRFYTYGVLPGLISRYSARIRSLDLCVLVSKMPKDFTFSKQLTHLSIRMDGYERRMLPKIFAPSLQYLKISEASVNITWNWFYSENKDVHTWFNDLKELWIIFANTEEGDMPAYHIGKIAINEGDRFNSYYKQWAKRVHFPALEKLRVENYPYPTPRFYKPFIGSPLKDIYIDSHRDGNYHIPAEIFRSLTNMYVNIGFRRSKHHFFDYEGTLTKLFSSPSTVHSCIISLRTKLSFSLPSEMRWIFIQNLKLEFYIDFHSVYNILYCMPNLKKLDFKTLESGIANQPKRDLKAKWNGHYKEPNIVNKKLECISWYICCSNEKPNMDSVMYCVLKVLPLVPSLLKLKINDRFVDKTMQTLARPPIGIKRRLPRCLEVVGIKARLTLVSKNIA